MLRQPLSLPPDLCTSCELAHPGCELCRTNDCHCMKYHVEIIAHTPPCTWRQNADPRQIGSALSLANDQLRVYYHDRHLNKKRPSLRCGIGKKKGHTRGYTTRLTITLDMFDQ